MAQIIPFNPSANANFRFQPTLDGVTYSAVCVWNVYSNRYYFGIYTTQGVALLFTPIIASPNNANINLSVGFFTTPIVFRASSNNFEIG